MDEIFVAIMVIGISVLFLNWIVSYIIFGIWGVIIQLSAFGIVIFIFYLYVRRNPDGL
jgi:hypothetical protein